MTDSKKTVNVEVLTDETQALATSAKGIVGATKTKTALNKVLADEHARALLTNTVTTFVNVDMRFTTGMKAIGEICVNVLDKDEDLQRKVIHALCDSQGIPRIDETGRKGLAMVLFAKFPDMFKLVKGGKDTYAGQRLTSYMAAYRADKGGSSNGPRQNPDPNQPRSAKDLFSKLYLACTNKEQSDLLRIAKRAKVKFDDWLPETEEGEASE